MKSVLISIQPKWCEEILSGEKTIEIRKTKPKIKTPFKCYIYCTKERNKNDGLWGDPILKTVCIDGEEHVEYASGMPYLNGSVIGEFVCDIISAFDLNGLEFYRMKEQMIKLSCLTENEFQRYVGEKICYGWHISDLKIYDKPKELGEFDKPCNKNANCAYCKQAQFSGGKCNGRITRPPQSWCYVEEQL